MIDGPDHHLEIVVLERPPGGRIDSGEPHLDDMGCEPARRGDDVPVIGHELHCSVELSRAETGERGAEEGVCVETGRPCLLRVARGLRGEGVALTTTSTGLAGSRST